MFRVQLTDVTQRYDDRYVHHRLVLDRVSLSVRAGERVGVVGDNGAGKSTLLRLLAGRETPVHGTVTVESPGGLGHLPQTLELPGGADDLGTATVGDLIDHALAGIRELEDRIRAAEAALAAAGDRAADGELDAYAGLTAAYEARGGADADRRVDTVLRRLGAREPLDRARPLATLSGGLRSRLALAATLAADPELLLLDEPTNDLDDEAVAWLEKRLRGHRGTVVAVTHDRVFLDRVATAILEVDHETRTVRRYGNGYVGYLAGRAADRARREVAYEEWRTERERNAALADRNTGRLAAIPRKGPSAFSGAGAFRARSRTHGAMSRIRAARTRLRELDERTVPRPPDPLRFTACFTARVAARVAADRVPTASDRASTASDRAPTAVDLTGVRVGGRLRLDALRLDPGERLLVTGPNGAGKSTLLAVLAGELAPDSGTVTTPERSRVGLLRQDTAGAADPRPLAAAFGAGREDELLALGLFTARDLAVPVRLLSAGQRRKLELARLVTRPVDLLLLDEPTNHLSPGLVEEMDAALAAYPGTLVVVSHDRRLRAGFQGRRLELAPVVSAFAS
ncbi:ABC-F family ATP-binding cassette domain-containing protein [Streptomyces laurentii]|uniref:ABC-F family ATP-binding cassette domain-containing protein n=1 Tax=Streptomyces laurentii TaxID=39478 RepID=UPI0036A8E2D1